MNRQDAEDARHKQSRKTEIAKARNKGLIILNHQEIVFFHHFALSHFRD